MSRLFRFWNVAWFLGLLNFLVGVFRGDEVAQYAGLLLMFLASGFDHVLEQRRICRRCGFTEVDQ